jgi:chromosome segregation ATPase
LVIIAEGAPENGGGTWLHPKLGIIFARWLSPHFAVWCDEQIADLLQQYPEHQQLFPELSQVLDKLTEYQQQADQRFYAMEQHIQAAEQRLGQYINQRFCAIEQHMRATEQRTEQRLDTNEQALNRFHERSLQENRHNLGQIYKNIQKIEKALYQQHQGDLLQPSVAEMLKEVLLEYQQFLKQMLHQNQDELTQRIDQIVQQLPVQPAAPQPLTAEPLAAEIAALRADGQSWKAIAENLNTNGIQTVSGKGKWHGSSVKKYLVRRVRRVRFAP